ncbi:MAG: hypothetical protein WAO52_15045 [Prolixibacteraceae bacterium]
MKTTFNFRQYFPVLTISLVLVASTIDVNAQNRRTEKKNKENNKTECGYSEHYGNGDSEYSENRNSEGRYENKGYKNQKSNKVYRPQYTRKFKHTQPDYFNHPKYGRVYQRFDHNPVVFKHDHGNYYYFNDHFYSYRRGVGYYLIETPRNISFERLPFGCDRVLVNGNVLFRNGDLFFKLSRRGYTLVNAPIEVRFSARF